MKKKFLITALIICLPAVAQATTYHVGSGETYETLAAFHSAITPAAGDIVECTAGQTFNERLTLISSGEFGNHIIYSNCTVSSSSSGVSVDLDGNDYITFLNCDFSGGTVRTMDYDYGAAVPNRADHITFTNTTVHDSVDIGARLAGDYYIVQNSRIYDNSGPGMRIQNSYGSKILGSRFTGNGTDEGVNNHDGFEGDGFQDYVISGSTFDDNHSPDGSGCDVNDGSNVVYGPSFVDWADPTVPNYWTKTGTHDASNYVEESPADSLHLVSNGTYVGVTQDIHLVDGAEYQYSIVVSAVTSGSLRVAFGATVVTVSSPGTYAGVVSASSSSTLTLARNSGATDLVVDSVSVLLVQSGGLIEENTFSNNTQNGLSVKSNGTYDSTKIRWNSFYGNDKNITVEGLDVDADIYNNFFGDGTGYGVKLAASEADAIINFKNNIVNCPSCTHALRYDPDATINSDNNDWIDGTTGFASNINTSGTDSYATWTGLGHDTSSVTVDPETDIYGRPTAFTPSSVLTGGSLIDGQRINFDGTTAPMGALFYSQGSPGIPGKPMLNIAGGPLALGYGGVVYSAPTEYLYFGEEQLYFGTTPLSFGD